MKACHSIVPVFDDPNLVSAAGLVPVLELAGRAGLDGLLAEHLSVPSPNAVDKSRSVIAGMLAGADSIDDLDLLRAGGMARVVAGVRAPSTLGTFLRTFTHGHVQQIDKITGRVLAGLTRQVSGLLAGGRAENGMVFVDVDDTIRAVHGYAKQAAGFGYSRVRGLNVQLATVSTPTAAPVIADCSGAANHDTADAISSGWRMRPIGWCTAKSSIDSRAYALRLASRMPVSVEPGQTALTVMPAVPSSLATLRTRPTTPCFAATYAEIDGCPPSPAAEAMAMTRPVRGFGRFRMTGIAAENVRQTPERLMSMLASHLSSSVRHDCCPPAKMPAAATTMSSPPNRSTAVATAASRPARSRTSAAMATACVPAESITASSSARRPSG